MLRTFLRSWPAVLRWKNGLWSSAILASESEAEHSEKKIITRNSKLIKQITQQPLNHHWIIITVEKHSVVRKIFSAGSISSAWLCVSVLSWQRWESDPAKSNPSILASWPAIQLEQKTHDAADLFRSTFCVLVFVLDLFCWSVQSFVVCLGLYCFRFYFCMFGFYGEYFCRSFFSFLPRPGRGTRALGFPGRFGSADRSPRPKSRKSRFATSIGATLETNKNNLRVCFVSSLCILHVICCFPEQKHRSGLRFDQLLLVESCFQDLEKDPNARFSFRSIHAFEWKFLHS